MAGVCPEMVLSTLDHDRSATAVDALSMTRGRAPAQVNN
jgi:hypothetical protein